MPQNFARKLQKLFGGSLSPTGNIAQFGSLAAGTPAYSLDPDLIQTARFLSAWSAGVINTGGGSASPALQDMNALFYLLTYQVSYLMQKGIPDWLSTDTYYTDDFVKVAGAVFISKADNNTGNNPLTDTNSWKTLASTLVIGAAQLRAWVAFDGNSGTIQSGYNVANITKTAVGCYIVNFVTPLTDALYGFSGSAGVAAGGAFGPGDDNVITGGFSGRVAVKSNTQLSVFCVDPTARQLQDSNSISVQIFGNP